MQVRFRRLAEDRLQNESTNESATFSQVLSFRSSQRLQSAHFCSKLPNLYSMFSVQSVAVLVFIFTISIYPSVLRIVMGIGTICAQILSPQVPRLIFCKNIGNRYCNCTPIQLSIFHNIILFHNIKLGFDLDPGVLSTQN